MCLLYTELKVTVSADYRPAPGEAPGELGPNEFTAGSELTLNCLAQGNSSELSYKWSVSGNPSTPPDCTGCDIDLSSTGSTRLVGKPPLYSYYAGVYTCTVSEAGRSDSGNGDNFTVTVVGKMVRGGGLLALLPRGLSITKTHKHSTSTHCAV